VDGGYFIRRKGESLWTESHGSRTGVCIAGRLCSSSCHTVRQCCAGRQKGGCDFFFWGHVAEPVKYSYSILYKNYNTLIEVFDESNESNRIKSSQLLCTVLIYYTYTEKIWLTLTLVSFHHMRVAMELPATIFLLLADVLLAVATVPCSYSPS